MCGKAFVVVFDIIMYISDDPKTQEICNKAVGRDPRILRYVPDYFIHQEMCNKAVDKRPWNLEIFLIVLKLRKYVI